MLPQCLKEEVSRLRPIPGGLQIIVYGQEGPCIQGDAPEFLPLADGIDHSLVAVGLEIPGLQAAEFGFS